MNDRPQVELYHDLTGWTPPLGCRCIWHTEVNLTTIKRECPAHGIDSSTLMDFPPLKERPKAGGYDEPA